jgi:hypothetical protein
MTGQSQVPQLQPMPWPVVVMLLASASLAVTYVLSSFQIPGELFGLFVFLSGPSVLYFFAGHGGSYVLWAVGVALVSVPLVLSRVRGGRGIRPYIGSAVVWLGLGVVFGLPFLASSLA